MLGGIRNVRDALICSCGVPYQIESVPQRIRSAPRCRSNWPGTWAAASGVVIRKRHVLGKLLLHLGEDRILWGTDSIWYGTPQDQISAFRTFEIPQSMQEMYGYPPLTTEAKAKILGLTAAGVYGVDVEATRCAIREDDVSMAKLAIQEDPSLRRPSYRRAGPQSRREFFRYLKLHEGQPG